MEEEKRDEGRGREMKMKEPVWTEEESSEGLYVQHQNKMIQ